MDSKLTNHQQASVDSRKKKLARAAMAASLGMALGVPVSDVLAAAPKMDSPPSLAQDKSMKSSGQMKFSNQQKMSNQHKDKQSSQIKIDREMQQKSLQR